jgi:hypothetical protein
MAPPQLRQCSDLPVFLRHHEPRLRSRPPPSALTMAIMISTAATPACAFTCGRTKTPSVAPILAEAAAKPPAEARILVGNSSGANANVVALGPAFMAKLNCYCTSRVRSRVNSASLIDPSFFNRSSFSISSAVLKPITRLSSSRASWACCALRSAMPLP